MPMPSDTRPPVRTDAVATVLAVVKGSRMGSTYTLVKNCSRSVTAPRAPIVTIGSIQGSNGFQRRSPVSV